MQYGDFDNKFGEGRCQRFREAPEKLSRALQTMQDAGVGLVLTIVSCGLRRRLCVLHEITMVLTKPCTSGETCGFEEVRVHACYGRWRSSPGPVVWGASLQGDIIEGHKPPERVPGGCPEDRADLDVIMSIFSTVKCPVAHTLGVWQRKQLPETCVYSTLLRRNPCLPLQVSNTMFQTIV